jgi:hypothetical protein
LKGAVKAYELFEGHTDSRLLLFGKSQCQMTTPEGPGVGAKVSTFSNAAGQAVKIHC